VLFRYAFLFLEFTGVLVHATVQHSVRMHDRVFVEVSFSQCINSEINSVDENVRNEIR